MSDQVRSAVEALEAEAERILDEARNRAEALLRTARAEARRLDEQDLPVADVEAECTARIEAAREEARRLVEAGALAAEALEARVTPRIGEHAAKLVRVVAGEAD